MDPSLDKVAADVSPLDSVERHWLIGSTIITFLVLEQLKGGVDRYRKTGGTLM